MNALRAAVACLLLLTCSVAASPSYKQLNRVTGQLITPEGNLCSGTVWGAVILTTKHCLDDDLKEVRFRGINSRVLGVRINGENAMVKVDADLGPSANIGKLPKVGAVVWIVGNPMGFEQVFREGRLIGMFKGEPLLDCRCWQGDSGAGVFDDKGRLVGIFYGAYLDESWDGGINFTVPYFHPFAFTRDDWDWAAK